MALSGYSSGYTRGVTTNAATFASIKQTILEAADRDIREQLASQHALDLFDVHMKGYQEGLHAGMRVNRKLEATKQLNGGHIATHRVRIVESAS